jgi:hypothetical protein
VIPGEQNRCFHFSSNATYSLSKTTADYYCKVKGGSLIVFENKRKLNSVVAWLNSKIV